MYENSTSSFTFSWDQMNEYHCDKVVQILDVTVLQLFHRWCQVSHMETKSPLTLWFLISSPADSTSPFSSVKAFGIVHQLPVCTGFCSRTYRYLISFHITFCKQQNQTVNSFNSVTCIYRLEWNWETQKQLFPTAYGSRVLWWPFPNHKSLFLFTYFSLTLFIIWTSPVHLPL